MKHKLSRFLMTLVALFAMTTGAWAAEESESFDLSSSKTYNGAHFTVTGIESDNNGLFLSSATVTVTSLNGENITSVEFHIYGGKAKAENIIGTPGTNNCTNGNPDGSIININAISVTLGTENIGNTSVQIKGQSIIPVHDGTAAPLPLRGGAGVWSVTFLLTEHYLPHP